MSQCLLPYKVEVAEEAEEVTARAGLPLVVEAMRALGLEEVIGQELKLRERNSGYGEVQKVEALVLLLASGGECLDDINILRADAGLCRLLERKLPSADVLLSFLYAFHDERLIVAAQKRRPPGAIAYIPEENEALRALGRINGELVHRVASQGKCTKATLDHDATVVESHKKLALAHYKGGRGYQPVALYWAEQDLVIADEYRDGNVPAGMENLRLIRRGFANLPEGIVEFFFRSDSACYDEAVLKWLSNPGREGGPKGTIGFTISADMTPELRTICMAVPKEAWQKVEERPHETVFCAEVEFTPGNWHKDAAPLRYLAVRFEAKQGELFGNGSAMKHLAVVTNREGNILDLLRWHWQKAGTIEHVHDVTKNELGAAVLPCGRFGANAAWYRLSLLTYNVLSAMKSLALPTSFHSARPKRIRYAVFTIAGRIISHAGRLYLRVAADAERIAGLMAGRTQLEAIAARICTS